MSSRNLLMRPFHKEKRRRRNDIHIYSIELGTDPVAVVYLKLVS